MLSGEWAVVTGRSMISSLLDILQGQPDGARARVPAFYLALDDLNGAGCLFPTGEVFRPPTRVDGWVNEYSLQWL
jgi:hypothetical protein